MVNFAYLSIRVVLVRAIAGTHVVLLCFNAPQHLMKGSLGYVQYSI